jgi:hypothetical protein
MLELKIEIIPFGDEAMGRRNISTMRIINDGKHKQRPEWGSYKIECDGITCHVPNHKRNWGAWRLVQSAVDKFLEARQDRQAGTKTFP